MDAEKKERERTLLDWFRMDAGLNENGWTVREREGPDFECVMSGTSILGIEVTEMLDSWQGRDRANDGRLTWLIKDVVSQYIESHDGKGAYVYGSNGCVPSRGDWEGHLRANLQQHLRVYGSPLQRDGGTVEVQFRHPYGIVDSVHRSDR